MVFVFSIFHILHSYLRSYICVKYEKNIIFGSMPFFFIPKNAYQTRNKPTNMRNDFKRFLIRPAVQGFLHQGQQGLLLKFWTAQLIVCMSKIKDSNGLSHRSFDYVKILRQTSTNPARAALKLAISTFQICLCKSDYKTSRSPFFDSFPVKKTAHVLVYNIIWIIKMYKNTTFS